MARNKNAGGCLARSADAQIKNCPDQRIQISPPQPVVQVVCCGLIFGPLKRASSGLWLLHTNRGELALSTSDLLAGPHSKGFVKKALENLLYWPLPISARRWQAAVRLLGGWA